MEILGWIGLVLLVVFVPPMLEPIGCWEYRFEKHINELMKFILAALLLWGFYWCLTAVVS